MDSGYGTLTERPGNGKRKVVKDPSVILLVKGRF